MALGTVVRFGVFITETMISHWNMMSHETVGILKGDFGCSRKKGLNWEKVEVMHLGCFNSSILGLGESAPVPHICACSDLEDISSVLCVLFSPLSSRKQAELPSLHCRLMASEHFALLGSSAYLCVLFQMGYWEWLLSSFSNTLTETPSWLELDSCHPHRGVISSPQIISLFVYHHSTWHRRLYSSLLFLLDFTLGEFEVTIVLICSSCQSLMKSSLELERGKHMSF